MHKSERFETHVKSPPPRWFRLCERSLCSLENGEIKQRLFSKMFSKLNWTTHLASMWALSCELWAVGIYSVFGCVDEECQFGFGDAIFGLLSFRAPHHHTTLTTNSHNIQYWQSKFFVCRDHDDDQRLLYYQRASTSKYYSKLAFPHIDNLSAGLPTCLPVCPPSMASLPSQPIPSFFPFPFFPLPFNPQHLPQQGPATSKTKQCSLKLFQQ